MDIIYSALVNPTVCCARQEVPTEVGLEPDPDMPVRKSAGNGQFVFVFMAYDDGGRCFSYLNLCLICFLLTKTGFRLTTWTSGHLSSKIKRFFGADWPELEPLVIRDRPQKRFISREVILLS